MLYQCIRNGNCYHFWLKNGNNFHTQCRTLQGYIFCILQHFMTKFWNFTTYFKKVLSGNFLFSSRSKMSLQYNLSIVGLKFLNFTFPGSPQTQQQCPAPCSQACAPSCSQQCCNPSPPPMQACGGGCASSCAPACAPKCCWDKRRSNIPKKSQDMSI